MGFSLELKPGLRSRTENPPAPAPAPVITPAPAPALNTNLHVRIVDRRVRIVDRRLFFYAYIAYDHPFIKLHTFYEIV